MSVKLGTDSIRNIAAFEKITEVHAHDCLITEECVYFLVDPEKVGKQMLAFCRLTIAPNSHALADINSLCAQQPDVLECHNVAGEDCVILKIRASGPRELEKLLTAIKARADASRSITNIVLSSSKESTRIVPAPPADEGD